MDRQPRVALAVVARTDRWTCRQEVPLEGIVVGRAADCSLRLHDEAVSRHHCRLTPVDGGVLVEDLGSRDGTRIDGVRIEGPAQAPIGAAIELGRSVLRVDRAEATLELSGDAVADGRAVETILAAIGRLGDADDLDGMLRAIVVAGCEVAGGERGALFLDRAGAGLELAVTVDRMGTDLRPDEFVTRTVPARALETGRAVVVADTQLAEVSLIHSPSITLAGLRSVVCVPLPGERGPSGVLYVDSRRPVAAIGPTERALLEALAAHASLAIVRTQRRHDVELQTQARQRQLEDENRRLRTLAGRDRPEPDPVGSSAAMLRLTDLLRRIAPSVATVCLLGETGTGKELLARWVHRLSPRASGPFVVLDCGAIPEHLIESELFGHERGAFTGAVTSRDGRFRDANGGTIFLDEIGDLPLALQSRLLRVVQERQVQPVGGRAVPIDVRILCATHRDLPRMVADGRFREDLYYRIAVVTAEVPPLRARGDDALLLARTFLAAGVALPGASRPKGFSVDAVAAIQRHRWPGNVRELEQRVHRSVLLATGPYVTAADLGLAAEPDPLTPSDPAGMPTLKAARAAASEQFERAYLLALLERVEGSMSEAVRASGVSRQLLHRLLVRHGIDRRQHADDGEET